MTAAQEARDAFERDRFSLTASLAPFGPATPRDHCLVLAFLARTPHHCRLRSSYQCKLLRPKILEDP